MKVLLCINDEVNSVGERLERMVGSVISGGHLRTCRGLEEFSQRLYRRPWEGYGIAVILATNNQELEGFIALRELLDGLSIILILPHRGNGALSKWHCLYPRFVTDADSDFKDVAAVLGKMYWNLKDKKY